MDEDGARVFDDEDREPRDLQAYRWLAHHYPHTD
jgi:hypothetical protein